MKKTDQQKRRTKGEGSLTILPNGKYKMTITVGKGIDGKQIRRAVTAESKAELMEKVSELRLDKTPKQAREMTFGQLFKEFKKEALRDKADGTQAAYSVMWNHFEGALRNARLAQISTNYISSLLLSMTNRRTGEEMKNNTLILNRRLLSAIFNFAIAKGYLLKNPCVGALKGMKETHRADLQIISEDQLKAMLKDAMHHDRYINYNASEGIHWYPILLFLSATGLRRGELLGLRKSCVDLDTGIIDIRAQVKKSKPDLPLKTKASYRRIHVDKDVLNLVMEDSDPESDFVFANRKTHQNIPLDTLGGAFRSFLGFYDNRPFPEFSLHNLRHYHATKLLTAGVDVKSVSRRLGHSNVQTTLERYAHWLPEVDERARSIVGANLIIKE